MLGSETANSIKNDYASEHLSRSKLNASPKRAYPQATSETPLADTDGYVFSPKSKLQHPNS